MKPPPEVTGGGGLLVCESSLVRFHAKFLVEFLE
jgi:hypothetical protein